MLKLIHKDITIRKAMIKDAEMLCKWWNDGFVMAHAGFPNGIGTTVQTVQAQLRQAQARLRLLIEYQNIPIGEMMLEFHTLYQVEFGIKICDLSKQNQGIGTKVLSMMFQYLFMECQMEEIVCTTEFDNKRAQHVYEQLGFKKAKTLHHVWCDETGIWHDGIFYVLKPKRFHSYI